MTSEKRGIFLTQSSGDCGEAALRWGQKRLMELAPADSEELRAAWQAAAEGALMEEKERRSFTDIPEQFLLLVTCRDERQQVELLQRFHDEGIQVKALIS